MWSTDISLAFNSHLKRKWKLNNLKDFFCSFFRNQGRTEVRLLFIYNLFDDELVLLFITLVNRIIVCLLENSVSAEWLTGIHRYRCHWCVDEWALSWFIFSIFLPCLHYVSCQYYEIELSITFGIPFTVARALTLDVLGL